MLLANADVENAFRLISVYPGDLKVWVFTSGELVMEINAAFRMSYIIYDIRNFLYIPRMTGQKQSSLQIVHHYLNDCSFVGPAETQQCQRFAKTLKSL